MKHNLEQISKLIEARYAIAHAKRRKLKDLVSEDPSNETNKAAFNRADAVVEELNQIVGKIRDG